MLAKKRGLFCQLNSNSWKNLVCVTNRGTMWSGKIVRMPPARVVSGESHHFPELASELMNTSSLDGMRCTSCKAMIELGYLLTKFVTSKVEFFSENMIPCTFCEM